MHTVDAQLCCFASEQSFFKGCVQCLHPILEGFRQRRYAELMQNEHWWESNPTFHTVVDKTSVKPSVWWQIALLLPSLIQIFIFVFNRKHFIFPYANIWLLCFKITTVYTPSFFLGTYWSLWLFSQLSFQKQTLEKELDTLKEKLKWTEGQLKESQNKEAQTQAKLMVTHTHEQNEPCVYYSLAILAIQYILWCFKKWNKWLIKWPPFQHRICVLLFSNLLFLANVEC